MRSVGKQCNINIGWFVLAIFFQSLTKTPSRTCATCSYQRAKQIMSVSAILIAGIGLAAPKDAYIHRDMKYMWKYAFTVVSS